ncbi:MAG: hypothetical protein ABFD54_01255 [Armatimonadota bacterium]
MVRLKNTHYSRDFVAAVISERLSDNYGKLPAVALEGIWKIVSDSTNIRTTLWATFAALVLSLLTMTLKSTKRSVGATHVQMLCIRCGNGAVDNIFLFAQT